MVSPPNPAGQPDRPDVHGQPQPDLLTVSLVVPREVLAPAREQRRQRAVDLDVVREEDFRGVASVLPVGLLRAAG